METKIFVGNLPLSVDFDRLRHLFERYGLLVEMALEQDDSGGSAWITMLTMRDALQAIQDLNGTHLDDQVIEVRLNLEGHAEPVLIPGSLTLRGVLAQELHVSNL